MAELVCPKCLDPDHLTETVEIVSVAWRTWTGAIRNGERQVRVGKAESDTSWFDEHGLSELACACGWKGTEYEVVQIGWDGKPVPQPMDGQQVLLGVAA